MDLQTIKIRLYRNDDWELLCNIHDASRPGELEGNVPLNAFIPLRNCAENEGLFDDEVWVAELDSVVGFIAFEKDYVNWLYVHPSYQRKGIGRKLLRFALERMDYPIKVSLLSKNHRALNLYEKEGFSIIKTKKGKLSGNEKYDAEGHIMEKDCC